MDIIQLYLSKLYNSSILKTTTNKSGESDFTINFSKIKDFFSRQNVLSDSDTAAITAYNNEFTRLSERISQSGISVSNYTIAQKAANTTMANASEQAKNLVTRANGNIVALNSMTKSSKAAALGMNALATAGNMLIMWGISEAISSLYKLSQTSSQVAEKAHELGSSFQTTKSTIEEYKATISSLHNTINDSSSSIEDVTNARKNLLSIQDELIEKFGTEKASIELITDAINGQEEAFNKLSQREWQKIKNGFNEGGWTNNVSNFFSGYENNVDRMLNEYGDYKATIDLSVATVSLSPEKAEELKQTFENNGMQITYGKKGIATNIPYVELSGTATEVHEKLLRIQEMFSKDNPLSTGDFRNHLTELANSANTMSNQYKEMYDNYILYEVILKNDGYRESFNNISNAYSKYQNAVASGNKEEIEQATEAYYNTITSSTDKALKNKNTEVSNYFESMHPELQLLVKQWDFKTKILPEFNTNVLHGKTERDLLKMLQTEGTQRGEDIFDSLLQKASDYEIIMGNESEKTQALLDLLVQWGVLQEDISKIKNEYLSFPDAWNSLDATEDDSLKTLKNDLLSLAETGQLTVESFNNTKGSEDFLAKLGLEPGNTKEIEEVIGKVNQLVSSSEQLASMKKGISGLTENLRARQENPGKPIDSEVLAGMDEGLKAQTEEWANYQSVMGDATSSMEQVQEATNRLASAFLNNNNYLANLTESEKNYYISQLEAMGVANAEEIVQQSLAEKYDMNSLKANILKLAKGEVTDASVAEVNAFLMEQGASKAVANAFLSAATAKKAFAATGLNLNGDIAAIESLVGMLFGTEAAIEFVNKTGGFDDRGFRKTNGMSKEQALQEIIEENTKRKTILLNGIQENWPSSSPSGRTPSETPKTETPETFNFIETAIARIKTKIDEVKNAAKEAFASFKSRSHYYASAISEIGREIDIQTQAEQSYTKRAENLGLDPKYASQIRDGSMNIETISDDGTKKRIREYKEWYEKALACREAVKALKKEQQELAREKIELRITRYEKLFSRFDAKNNKIKNSIDVKEAWGSSADIKSYKAMNKNIRSQIGNIRSQNKELAKLKATVAKSSEEWYEYDKRMQSNNETAQNLKKTMVENAKAAAALSKAKADKKISKFDSEDALTDARLDSVIRPKLKNGLINDKIENIKKRKDAYKAAVKTDKHNVKVTKNRLIKNAAPKKAKTTAEKNIRKNIQALAKAGKPITSKLLKAAYNLKDKGKLYNACLMYNAYLEARDADKAAADLYAQTSKQDKADLAMERFHNTAAGYDYSLADNEQKKAALNSKISLDEEQGHKGYLAYYEQLLSAENGTQKKLTAKRNALQKSLDQAVSRGLIKHGSDEWHEMVDAINSVTNEIDESVLSATELKNTIRQIKWDTFDASLETIQRINSEADFLIDLMGKNKDLTDKDNGEFTEYGKATLKLYKQQYESYLAQADAYAQEYNSIMKQIGKGQLSLSDDAVVQRLRELQDAQRDSKLSAEDILSSIIDLIRNGYEAQLDALDKLIQKYKDLRQNEKDAYEYQKNIAEKTKTIAALQKQLHAYGGNDTEEARAKIQKLKVDLEAARQNLAEAEYDKYLSDMNDMLDGLYDDFESFIDEKLNDTDAILAMINDSLCSGSDSIIATLAALNGEPSTDLQELLKGNITSSEYVKRIIEKDQKAQEERKQKEENERKEEERQKGRQLKSNAQSAQIMIPEIDRQLQKEKDDLAKMQDRLAVINAEEKKQKKLWAYAEKGRPSTDLPQEDFSKEKKLLTQNISASKKKINSLNKKRNAYEADINAYETWKKQHKDLEFPTLQPSTGLTILSTIQAANRNPGSEASSADSQVQAQFLQYAQMAPEDVRTFLHIEPQAAYAACAAPPELQRDLDVGNVNVAINELSLPGVTNYEDFRAALIRDNKFEKAIQSMTIDRAVGGHSMAKLKHI